MSAAAPAGAAPAAPALPPLMEKLRAQPKLPLIVGAAALVAAAAAFMLWSRAPDYKVLYTNVSDRDGGAIIASLAQMNVPYKFAEGGGAILVAGDKVHEVRLKLAAQGLPKGGGVGFELMDNQKFGTSQFPEQINYQRGLEGELARSIQSLGTVESARVHLALPKPSLFVRDQKKPSASVLLSLHRGRSIDEGQVSAIVHLVSSSVPELDAKSVTVVDQRGNLLSAANAGARGLDVSQLKYAQEIEQGYIRRIEAILQPIVGASNVRAQVAADIDFSVVERTDEKYSPNQDPRNAAIRSQQSSESSQHGGTPPGGVPGALSNQPPVNPSAPITAPRPPAAPGAPGTAAAAPAAASTTTATSTAPGAPASLRKDVTTNYELDRTIRHVQQGAGAIKRLSVAVVVNNRDGADGKAAARALARRGDRADPQPGQGSHGLQPGARRLAQRGQQRLRPRRAGRAGEGRAGLARPREHRARQDHRAVPALCRPRPLRLVRRVQAAAAQAPGAAGAARRRGNGTEGHGGRRCR